MNDSSFFQRQLSLVESIMENFNSNFTKTRDDDLAKLARKAPGLLRKLNNHTKAEFPLEQRKYAQYFFVKGFLMDVSSINYTEEAFNQLGEAFGVDRTFLEPIIARGNCLLKFGGDLDRAKECFEFVVEKDPTGVVAFRRLAMVEIRQMEENGGGIAEEVVDECIGHAKKALGNAIKLGVEDGISWYILGNAHITAFIVRGYIRKENFQSAYKAYTRALEFKNMVDSPYLVYSMAVTNLLAENYGLALSGFRLAASLGDQDILPQQRDLEIVLNRIYDALLVVNNGPVDGISPRLSPKGASFASWDFEPSYEKTTVGFLTKGENRGKAVLAEVLASIENPGGVPLYYVARDCEGSNFVFNVYGSFRTGVYKFKLVRINLQRQVLVNAIPKRKTPSLGCVGKSRIY